MPKVRKADLHKKHLLHEKPDSRGRKNEKTKVNMNSRKIKKPLKARNPIDKFNSVEY